MEEKKPQGHDEDEQHEETYHGGAQPPKPADGTPNPPDKPPQQP